MKKRKYPSEGAGSRTLPPPGRDRARRVVSVRPWHALVGLCAALFVLLQVYGPALRGPFVFDDIYLPFTAPEFARQPLSAWISGVRPLLMFTFWANFRMSGLDPGSYHLVNVLLHGVAGILIFLVVRRLLQWADTSSPMREILAVFAGSLFLLHPVQTESVSYVASRSEALSVLLFYAAFTLFLYRRHEAVSWLETGGILLLFGAAVSTKEHAAVLPALLLLTDWFWNPGFSFQGIRRNWRLYVPLALGAAVAVRYVFGILKTADSAGFGLKTMPWYVYFFTECRAIWTYIRLFVLPYGQNIDYDMPVSHTLLERGAVFGLLALAAVVVAAFVYRRRFKLASFGVFAFLLLLAPTSSIVPIADPLAERRMYLPMLGLLLVAVEFLRRWKTDRKTLAGALATVLLVAGFLTWQRNRVWSSDLALWQDSVAKAPANPRAHFQLAMVHYAQGHCEAALREYDTIARLSKPDYRVLLDWGLAYDCLNQPEEALKKFRQAAALNRTGHIYSLIGMALTKLGRRSDALESLNTAASIDPSFETTYLYRGNLHASAGEWQAALDDFRRALAINPQSATAAQGAMMVESRMKALR